MNRVKNMIKQDEFTKEFIEHFNDIEKYLKAKEKDSHKSFNDLIFENKKNDSTISFYYEELKYLKNLRNMLVHNNKYYAIPNKFSLNQIKKIKEKITDPELAYPLFSSEVLTVNDKDTIIETIKIMKEKSYSQVPVVNQKNKFIDLLTNNTISRWIGSLEDNGGGRIIMDDTLVGDVLDYGENYYSYDFISRKSKLPNVIDKFEKAQESGNKLEALFITQNGNKNESLLGIITSWDLPEIYSKLSV